MLMRAFHAVVIGIAVYVVCLVLAIVLHSLKVAPAETAAGILDQFAYIFAALAALFDFFGPGIGPSFGARA
jgi:hypothetical protein